MLDSRDQERSVNTHAEAEIEERPRETTFWDHQSDLVAEALGTALTDPEIDGCWDYIMIKLHAALKQPPHVLPSETEIRVMAAPLIRLLQERVPAFEHAWESNLGPFIIELMGRMIQSVAPEIDITIPKTNMKRLLPDNPIAVTAEGEAIVPGKAFDDPRHTRWDRELRDYFRSLRPEGTRGRRRKRQMDEPSKTGTRSLNPVLAEQAFTMNQRGVHWKEIARACYPHLTPSEHRADRMRKHIDRLRERGALAASPPKKTWTE